MRRRFSAFVLALLMFFTSLGVGGFMMVEKALAASCSSPPVFFGRACFRGYFKNSFDQFGDDVRMGGIPASVNTVAELRNLVIADLNSGNAHRRTAAQFLILTMIGRAAGLPQSVSAAQLTDWQNRLATYGNISENGTTSVGTNGRIDWFVWQHMPCGTPNTFYQDGPNDVAPYVWSPTNSDCEVASVLDDFILFRNTAGTIIYRIRRECMNPMGTIGALSTTPPPNFNLTPAIGTTVNGATGNVAQVGDTVRFTFTVRNTGTTTSTNTACNTYATTYTGYHAGGNPPPGGSPPGPSPGCPRNFAVGTTTVATQDVNIVTPNQTICRTLTVNPATFNGGPRTTDEICVIVANKPYMKVFGGDISAGSGLETAPNTCTNNGNAEVMTWNKRAAGGYAGAGTQYATFALNAITDFASSQNNAGGAAEPAGLSFANTATNVGVGNFGGSFGSVTCIPNYWSRKPTSTLGLPANVSTMNTGVYGATGTTTLNGGNVNPDDRISVYIDGNVFINSNITYAGNWNTSNAPLFQLVVRGNIYIGNGVTRLDGVFIAQRNGANGGTIYTCATGAAPISLTNGAFYNSCTNKLTVNGAFVANSVEFLRTGGTLSQSVVGETSDASGGGTSAGEVFNFNPALWMVQPVEGSGRVDGYDAITSLPPIL